MAPVSFVEVRALSEIGDCLRIWIQLNHPFLGMYVCMLPVVCQVRKEKGGWSVCMEDQDRGRLACLPRGLASVCSFVFSMVVFSAFSTRLARAPGPASPNPSHLQSKKHLSRSQAQLVMGPRGDAIGR